MDVVILIDKYAFHVAKQTKYNLNKIYLWHYRLGHINKQHIKKLQSDSTIASTGSDSFDVCEQCVCSKMTKKPFSDYLLQEFSRSDKILDKVQDTPTKPQTEEPSLKSIILYDSELVVEEVVPTNVVKQAPPENQENDVASTTPILRRSSRPSNLPNRYLRKTKDMFLVYVGLEDELSVKGYTYASFQTDWDDTKSQLGYMLVMNGRVVAWRILKQDTIAMSYIEADYVVVSEAAKAAYWMKKVIEELGVVPSIENPVKVYCNNSSTILLASECITQRCGRHILHIHHYIHEAIGLPNVEVIRVHTDDSTANPLMKALPCDKHSFHANGMGLRYIGLD
uniref:GAG-pre-integrase domain-containing protein n=1 Tax=Tanacetum cinerariifolium TaxID=118510 RepID=A0A699GXG1_TANCI|nr:hypothetical protein [Tanacetum cinerariifolium]